MGTGSNYDILVISLTNTGEERWIYRYDGTGNHADYGYSIAYGYDGNIYVAGATYGVTSFDDFTIISLTGEGPERWVYHYDRCGGMTTYFRYATVVMAVSMQLYGTDSITGVQATVISFISEFGVHENLQNSATKDFLLVAPNPFSDYTVIQCQTPGDDQQYELRIYDINGRLVTSFHPGLSIQNRESVVLWDGIDLYGRRLPTGVYFLKFKAGGFSTTEKLLLIK